MQVDEACERIRGAASTDDAHGPRRHDDGQRGVAARCGDELGESQTAAIVVERDGDIGERAAR